MGLDRIEEKLEAQRQTIEFLRELIGKDRECHLALQKRVERIEDEVARHNSEHNQEPMRIDIKNLYNLAEHWGKRIKELEHDERWAGAEMSDPTGRSGNGKRVG